MQIRKATEKDLVSIVELLSDDPLGSKREKSLLPLPNEYLKAFSKINEDENQELMVVESKEQEVIGTFQLSFIQYLNYCGGLRAQLETVQVKKTKRGEGVGKAILLWAIKRAKLRKAHLLQLTSDKKRPKAIKFYELFGFKTSHEGMKLYF